MRTLGGGGRFAVRCLFVRNEKGMTSPRHEIPRACCVQCGRLMRRKQNMHESHVPLQ
jgi:hypothetical protein